MFSYILLALISSTFAQIVVDLNCTYYNSLLAKTVYSPAAVVCNNVATDAACAALYTATPVKVDTDTARPTNCFGLAATGPIDASMKKAALDQCPKHCGLCCQTSAYNCRNALFPSMNCASVTQAQCLSQIWRPIIAKECPASCGFCNDGGCVDAVVECANDITICNSIAMQPFVNANCQKTCGRCSTTTTVTNTGGGSCTTYNADTSGACANWAANGFCTNDFYKETQRKQYCATTCKIC